MAGDRLAARLCELAGRLTPEERKVVVERVAAEGYSGREIAEIMGVSPAAVSRYLHGSLSPSKEAICRLLHGLDHNTLASLAEHIVGSILNTLVETIEALAEEDRELAQSLVEEAADRIADAMRRIVGF